MTKYTRRFGAPLLVAAALLGACRSEPKQGPESTALGADSTLNRDLAMANRDSTAQPQLKDVPANQPTAAPAPTTTRPRTTTPRTTPRTPAPRPSTPAPTTTTTTTKSGNTQTTTPGAAANPSATGGGNVGSIAAGTTLTTHSNAKVCTNTNAVGDHVTATLDNAVSGSNGATIPAGATVNLTVTRLKRSENANDPIIMEFAVNSVTFGGHTYPIDATVASADVTRIRDQPQSKDVQKGAAGAAAGAAAASATANYQGCIESGHSIVIKLTAPATVKA